MSDDEQRQEVEINESDLEESAPAVRQRSARNDPGMRDGDNSHGNPTPEDWAENAAEDSDTDVGDATPSLASEEFGVLDSIPANDEGSALDFEDAAVTGERDRPESRPASRSVDRHSMPESRRSRPESPPAPDRDLPLENYPSLTIPQIFEKIPTLSNEEVRAIRDYEKSHRRRKTLLVKLERHLRPTEGPNRDAGRSYHP
jgi:hypothetical protein